MNYASEDLINEHEGILYGLHILEKMIEMIKNQVNISIDELKEMVNSFNCLLINVIMGRKKLCYSLKWRRLEFLKKMGL